MNNVSELLDAIDESLDEGTNIPLMPGKHVVDVDKIHDFIEDVRRYLPEELHKAKVIVNDRAQILSEANAQADAIIKKAEERARFIVSEQEIVKSSQKRAQEIVTAAQNDARNLRKTVTDYCENMLKTTEKTMTANALQVKNVCNNLRQVAKDSTK